MVKIRLKRVGTTKRPVYRLVVADSRSPRDGRFIEVVGFYDPLPDPAIVRIDEEKVRDWMRKGARPSDSARQLLVQQGVLAAPARPAAATAARATSPDASTATEAAGPAASGSPPASVAADDAADDPASAGEPARDAPEGEPQPAPETGAPAEAQVDTPDATEDEQ